MKQLFTLAIFLFSTLAHAQSFEWEHFEPTNAYTPHDPEVATDDAGNVYKFSAFNETMILQDDTLVHFPANVYPHLYLLKFSPTGTLLWSRVFGTCYSDVVGKISVDDAGHIYVSMSHQCDTIFFEDTTVYTGYHTYHLLQFDNNGNFLRRTAYSQDVFIHHTTLGNDLYTSHYGTVTKHNSAFNIIWERTTVPDGTLNLSSFGRNGDIYVSDNGHLVVCGFEGQPGTIQFDTIDITFDGGFNDVGVISMDTAGNAFWGRSFVVGSGVSQTFANAVDNNGNVYLNITAANEFVFANDTINNPTAIENIGAVLKYDASGSEEWAVPLYSNNTTPEMNDLLVNEQQDVVLAASYSSFAGEGAFGSVTLPDGYHMLMSKINPSGNVQWIKSDNVNGPNSSFGFSIALLPNNRYAVTGRYQNNAVDPKVAFDCFTSPEINNGSYTAVVNELPAPSEPETNFTFTQSTGDVTFTNTTPSADSYSWDFGDGNTSTTTSPTHTYLQNGTYNVCLTATIECYENTFCDSVTIIGVGLYQVDSKLKVELFPNPVDELLSVKIISTGNDQHTITLNDLVGRTLQKIETKNYSTIDLSDYASGVYVIQIDAAQQTKTFRIVKH